MRSIFSRGNTSSDGSKTTSEPQVKRKSRAKQAKNDSPVKTGPDSDGQRKLFVTPKDNAFVVSGTEVWFGTSACLVHSRVADDRMRKGSYGDKPGLEARLGVDGVPYDKLADQLLSACFKKGVREAPLVGTVQYDITEGGFSCVLSLNKYRYGKKFVYLDVDLVALPSRMFVSFVNERHVFVDSDNKNSVNILICEILPPPKSRLRK